MVTLKQQRFINAYFENGGNGTQAALTAGYEGDENSLAAMGSHLLRNDKVHACIDERLEAEEVTPNWIIGNLKRVAGLSLTAPEITKTEYDRNGNVKSTSYDTGVIVKANEVLAKIRGMGRQEIDVTLTGPVRALIYAPPPGYELTAKVAENDDRAESEPEAVADGQHR